MARPRTITLLFTDVVSSTKLHTELGPEASEERRRRHFGELRGALAVHRGQEVKTLGDGMMAAFESVGDAVACAVTMQRAAARPGYTGAQLAIRIGLSIGEAREEAGDYFGTPVIEAARLCDAAEASQILVSDRARLLLGDEGLHRLEGRRDLDLKGIPEPVRAWAVDWDAGGDAALRVALAEDSVLLRQGVVSVLEAEGIEVVLQASDADMLMAGLPAARPHVAVLDVRMPPTYTDEGLVAAEQIRADYPDVGVLVLSAAVHPAAARRLLDGATEGVGYLLKERVAEVEELTAAIRTVASGGSAIDPEVVSRLATAD